MAIYTVSHHSTTPLTTYKCPINTTLLVLKFEFQVIFRFNKGGHLVDAILVFPNKSNTKISFNRILLKYFYHQVYFS